MVTFDALLVNDTTIKIDNRTDYYLDQWLYSDYGFELFYRPKRGIEEVYWQELLESNGFNLYHGPDPRIKGGRSAESRSRSIDFHEFLTRSFCMRFTSDKVYDLYFDYASSTMIMSNTECYWKYL